VFAGRGPAALFVVAVVLGGRPAEVHAANPTFTVNTVEDGHDAAPGDGICASSSGTCTLWAATEERRASHSSNGLPVKLPAGRYVLTLGSLPPDDISGDDQLTTIIDANHASSVIGGGNVAIHLDHLTIANGNSYGIAGSGNVSMSDGTITGNSDAGIGGGQLSVVLTNTVVEHNGGSGVDTGPFGSLQATTSTIQDNGGTGVFATNAHLISTIVRRNQRGLFSSGASGLTSSTVSDNAGDGVATIGCDSEFPGLVSVSNSTISGNKGAGIRNLFQANTGGMPGLEQCPRIGTIQLNYSTVALNGTGIVEENLGAGRRNLLNGTIVANNTSANCSEQLGDGDYNLDSGSSCHFSQPHSLSTSDPRLGPLANNGGPTATHALLTGSLALNAGGNATNGCPATDQRGVTRPQGPACDIGSYEAAAISTQPPTTAASLSGKAGANGWYVGPVTVILAATASQGGSPVASTTYSIDGGASQTYSAPFTITSDGKHVLTFSSTDSAGNAEQAQTVAVNIDQTAPGVTCSVSPNTLWPPNHKLVNVTATVNVSDATSGPAGFTLTSVTSNGGSASDIQGWTPGTPSTTGQLATNKDEVYTLVYQGADQAGNTASCTTTVSVRHDQGNNGKGKDKTGASDVAASSSASAAPAVSSAPLVAKSDSASPSASPTTSASASASAVPGASASASASALPAPSVGGSAAPTGSSAALVAKSDSSAGFSPAASSPSASAGPALSASPSASGVVASDAGKRE
jgi:hypothetical protein